MATAVTLKPGESITVTAEVAPVTPPPPPVPDPTPTPVPTPPPVGSALSRLTGIGVLHVQHETDAGLSRTRDAKGAISRGHHMCAFQGGQYGKPGEAGFVGDRLAKGKGVGFTNPAFLNASMAGKDLSYNGVDPWSSPDNSRLAGNSPTDPVTISSAKAWADRCSAVIDLIPEIVVAIFWQEMKGYDVWHTPGAQLDAALHLLNAHYVAWAIEMKLKHPNVLLAGPYTQGGMSDAQIARAFELFRADVTTPHPELVDAYAWDDSGATRHKWYTDTLCAGDPRPHIVTEWYPGGYNTSTTQTPGGVVTQICDILSNPKMGQLNHWGGGTDTGMKARLWQDNGVDVTAIWQAEEIAAPFVNARGITKVSTGVYKNGKGQTLTISGNSVTVV